MTAPTGGYVGQEMQWLPTNIRDFADHLRGEFRRGGGDQRIGAGVLQADGLAVDGGVRHFEGGDLDHHFIVIRAQAGF